MLGAATLLLGAAVLVGLVVLRSAGGRSEESRANAGTARPDDRQDDGRAGDQHQVKTPASADPAGHSQPADEQADLRGKATVISGRVRLVSQDMHSFLEGMGGHSVPMHPVVVLNWKQGAEVQCWFDAVDDRLASFRSGEEVSVKGEFDFAVPGVVILQHCVLLPEEGGVHVHPFDKEKAAAADAEAARLWQEREGVGEAPGGRPRPPGVTRRAGHPLLSAVAEVDSVYCVAHPR